MTNILKYLSFTCLLSIISCKDAPPRTAVRTNNTLSVHKRMYSKKVADTFSIDISLPEGYKPDGKEEYPVVYLLDANLYFDIAAATYRKYAETGMVKPVIVVGIGYKGLAEMDSLRCRDFTYPKALPEYEMAASGGADKFLSFLDKELLPYIDTQYKTDTNKRILMGHSLGGYFTTYALVNQVAQNNNLFAGFVAASPSLHYNNYYLRNGLEKSTSQKNGRNIKAYFTYGGLEDDESEPGLLKSSEEVALLRQFSANAGLVFKADVYSGLDHMDTPAPTFIKGLQWCQQG